MSAPLAIHLDDSTVQELVGGGTKQRQQTDIEQAKAMWAEYKGRKAAAEKSRGKG